MPIRILIADDHAIVRRGLRALISTDAELQLIGEASDGIEAVEKTRALKPDVVLMDLQMPRKNGIEAIREIVRANPHARILVLSSFADRDKVLPAIQSGALGYLLKDTSTDQDLLNAIRAVARGEAAVPSSIARLLIEEVRQPPAALLTAREQEVLQLIGKGLSNQNIAHKLDISERTVRAHVSNILTKLNLESRTQAAVYVLRERSNHH
ncbi:MAG: response regulator transcription factor [Chloroflexi bacterium]|nr:response regulator transcription factor [Chloroflexota bacterium]MBI3740242.1 response regulator transcription factor [Chloroflexota bacterium]